MMLPAPHRPWLDYQEEIRLRHTPEKKNQKDGTQTYSLVPLRYLVAFGAVVAIATRKFLLHTGVRDEELHNSKQPGRKLFDFTSRCGAGPTREHRWQIF